MHYEKLDIRPVTILTGEDVYGITRALKSIFYSYRWAGRDAVYLPAVRSALTYLSQDFTDVPWSDDSTILMFAQSRLLKGVELLSADTPSYVFGIVPVLKFIDGVDTLRDKIVCIEEPELHLSPELQIEMARLLVMMANKGAKVVFSTNSDFIVHEISNCIKLSYLSQQDQLLYLEKEKLTAYPSVAIKPDDVSAYVFKRQDNNAIIERLTVNDYGIDAVNFEEVTEELFNRSAELGERINITKQSRQDKTRSSSGCHRAP